MKTPENEQNPEGVDSQPGSHPWSRKRLKPEQIYDVDLAPGESFKVENPPDVNWLPDSGAHAAKELGRAIAKGTESYTRAGAALGARIMAWGADKLGEEEFAGKMRFTATILGTEGVATEAILAHGGDNLLSKVGLPDVIEDPNALTETLAEVKPLPNDTVLGSLGATTTQYAWGLTLTAGAAPALAGKLGSMGALAVRDAVGSFVAFQGSESPGFLFDESGGDLERRAKAAVEGVLFGAALDGAVFLGKNVIRNSDAVTAPWVKQANDLVGTTEEVNTEAIIKQIDSENAKSAKLDKLMKQEGVENPADLSEIAQEKLIQTARAQDELSREARIEAAQKAVDLQRHAPIDAADIPTEFLEEMDNSVFSGRPEFEEQGVKADFEKGLEYSRDALHRPNAYVELPTEVKGYLGAAESAKQQKENFWDAFIGGLSDSFKREASERAAEYTKMLDPLVHDQKNLRTARSVKLAEKRSQDARNAKKRYKQEIAELEEEAAMRRVQARAEGKDLPSTFDLELSGKKSELERKQAQELESIKKLEYPDDPVIAKMDSDLVEYATDIERFTAAKRAAENNVTDARLAAAAWAIQGTEVAALKTLQRLANGAKELLKGAPSANELYIITKQFRTTLSILTSARAMSGKTTSRDIKSALALRESKGALSDVNSIVAGSQPQKNVTVGSMLDEKMMSAQMHIDGLKKELVDDPTVRADFTQKQKRATEAEETVKAARSSHEEDLRIEREKMAHLESLERAGADEEDILMARQDLQAAEVDASRSRATMKEVERAAEVARDSFDQAEQGLRMRSKERMIATGDVDFAPNVADDLTEALEMVVAFSEEAARRGDYAGGWDALDNMLKRSGPAKAWDMFNELVTSSLLGVGSDIQTVGETAMLLAARRAAGNVAKDASSFSSKATKDEYAALIANDVKKSEEVVKSLEDLQKSRGETTPSPKLIEAKKTLAQNKLLLDRARTDAEASAQAFTQALVPFWMKLTVNNKQAAGVFDKLRDGIKNAPAGLKQTAKVTAGGTEPLGTARKGNPRLSTSDVMTMGKNDSLGKKAATAAAKGATMGNRFMHAADRFVTYGASVNAVIDGLTTGTSFHNLDPVAIRKHAVRVNQQIISERTHINAARQKLDELKLIDETARLPKDDTIFSEMDYSDLSAYEEMIDRRISDIDAIKSQDMPDDASRELYGRQRANSITGTGAAQVPMIDDGFVFDLARGLQHIIKEVPGMGIFRPLVPFLGTRASLGQRAFDMTAGVYVAHVKRFMDRGKKRRGDLTHADTQRAASRVYRMLNSHNPEHRMRAAFVMEAGIKAQAGILGTLLLLKDARDPEGRPLWTGALPRTRAGRRAWEAKKQTPTSLLMGDQYLDISNIPALKPLQMLMVLADAGEQIYQHTTLESAHIPEDDDVLDILMQGVLTMGDLVLDGGMGYDTLGEFMQSWDDYRAAADSQGGLSALARTAKMFVPMQGLVRDLRRILSGVGITSEYTTPAFTEAENAMEGIRSVYELDNPNKRYDFFGRTVDHNHDGTTRLVKGLTRVRLSKTSADYRVLDELEKIRYPFTKIPKTYQGVRLDKIKNDKGQTAYNRLYEILGSESYGIVDSIKTTMKDPTYATLSPNWDGDIPSPRVKLINDGLQRDVYWYAFEKLKAEMPEIEEAIFDYDQRKFEKETEIYNGLDTPLNR